MQGEFAVKGCRLKWLGSVGNVDCFSAHLRVYKGDSLAGSSWEVELPEVGGHRLHLLVAHPGLLQETELGSARYLVFMAL